MTHTVFVYGTLKRGHGNNRLLKEGGATFIGEAVTLKPYLLTTAGVPFMAKPKGNEPNMARVLGELWTCDDDTRDSLDWLEGHPQVYKREEIDVVMIGRDGNPGAVTTKAEAYFIQYDRHARPVALNSRGWLEWQRRVAQPVLA